jgi:hypothetical protein
VANYLVRDDPICFRNQGDDGARFRLVQSVGNLPQPVEHRFHLRVIGMEGSGGCGRHGSATLRGARAQRAQGIDDDGDIDGLLRQGAGDRRKPADRCEGHGYC